LGDGGQKDGLFTASAVTGTYPMSVDVVNFHVEQSASLFRAVRLANRHRRPRPNAAAAFFAFILKNPVLYYPLRCPTDRFCPW
jgi:hypothetical protein